MKQQSDLKWEKGQWAGEEAAGCIEHPGWKNNPKYSLVIPPGSPSTLHILLEQERHGADIQPFQIQPYKYFIGFYVGDTCKKKKKQRVCLFKKKV